MEVSRRELVRGSLLGGVGIALASSFGTSALAQALPQRSLMSEADRVALSQNPSSINGPVLKSSLSSRRMNVRFDLSDLDSPMILGDFTESDLFRLYDPASMMKCLTAMVCVRAHRDDNNDFSLDGSLIFSPEERQLNLRRTDSNYNNLPEILRTQQWATVSNALEMLLIGSRNGAAMALARTAAGSYERGVELINAEAQRIGMSRSYFINPSGLPANQDGMSASSNYNNASCIADLTRMMCAMRGDYPELDEFASKYTYSIPGHRFSNDYLNNECPSTNPLLRDYTNNNDFARRLNVLSPKTGYTRLSMYSLFSLAEPEEGISIGSITTGNNTGERGAQSRDLLAESWDDMRTVRFNERLNQCSTSSDIEREGDFFHHFIEEQRLLNQFRTACELSQLNPQPANSMAPVLY